MRCVKSGNDSITHTQSHTIMDETPKATYDNLDETGYLVVKGVLNAEECQKLSKALIHSTTDLVFTRQGFDVDADDPATLDLFMDQKLREKKLGRPGERPFGGTETLANPSSLRAAE